MALPTALIAALVLALYASSAEARCCRHGARFAGGMIVGAAIARPLPAFPPPVYYAPQVYYAPPVFLPPRAYYPPPPVVVYSSPPVYFERPRVGVPLAVSVEGRLRRLQRACSQGLFTAAECEAKRRELLRLM